MTDHPVGCQCYTCARTKAPALRAAEPPPPQDDDFDLPITTKLAIAAFCFGLPILTWFMTLGK